MITKNKQRIIAVAVVLLPLTTPLPASSQENYNRDLNYIKESITEKSVGNYMSESKTRFGVNQDLLTPLNSGMTLPTDFLFDGKGWEIVTSNAIFHVTEGAVKKLNITNVGLTEIIDGDKKVWINGKSISMYSSDDITENHKFAPISTTDNIQAFEIVGTTKKSLLLSVDGIPTLLSLPDLKVEKSYSSLAGYEVQHLSKAIGSSFLIAMKDGDWSLYKDVGGILLHESKLSAYANGLYAIDDHSAIVGNRNDLSLYSNGNLEPLITGFTHIMRIKKIRDDICVLDSDDPLLICFNESELLDKENKSPAFKVISGNLFSYSSIVGVAKNNKSDDIFITTRPGRIWKKNTETGLQEVVAGNGSNAWIDTSVPAIHSPIYYQTGIAFDGKYIYVAEQHGIYRVNITEDINKRKFELYAGNPTVYGDKSDVDRLDAKFLSIRDLSIDHDGSVLVADTGNHKIKKISKDGMVSTIVGGGTDYHKNKIGVKGTEFSLKEPLSMSSDSSGDLYVADSLDNIIIRVSPSGIVDKIIGNMMRIDYQGTGYGDYLFNTPSGVHVDNGKIFVTDSSSVKWINEHDIDNESCWEPVRGSWYYPMNPTIENNKLYINNTGSNDVKLSPWSPSDNKCK